MEQVLTITHRDGTTFALRSRGSSVIGLTGAQQDIELNANDTVTLLAESTEPLPFALGDTVTVSGMIYTLNLLPSIEKTAPRHYKYKAVFEGLHYLLLNTAWLMPFSALNDTYAGNLAEYAAQLVANLNRVYGNTWEVGTIKADTETLVLSYTDTNCLDVLQSMCEEWDVEFYITYNSGTGKYQLSIVDEVGSTINYVFKYGATGGLYELQRNGVNDADFATRIYFYGGSSNIPNDYFNDRQSTRLCLASKVVGNVLTNNPTRNESYIEQTDAINLYGRIERTKVFEDIYPNRIGSVTAIDADNELKFVDNTMFNLNATDGDDNTLYLINGTTAKIHFNTGALAGYDFDIVSYNHSTHTFKIDRLQDENNYTFPSEDNQAFRIAVGDEYIITDIVLPSSYVTAAQDELQAAAQDWYEKHCAPNVEYTLTMDEMFLKWLADHLGIADGQPIFHIGDTINVADANLWTGNKQFRVLSLQRDLTKKHSYSLQIAVNNERRRRYVWRRRRNNHILPFVERMGLNNPGFASQAAWSDHKLTRNSTRLVVLYDDDTGFLRPAAIADESIITRMIGAGAVVAAKIGAGAVVAEKIGSGAVTAAKLAAGAVTKNSLDAAIRASVERLSSRVYYDPGTATIEVTAGEYVNNMTEEGTIPITAAQLTADIDGNELDPDTEYYLYVDKNGDTHASATQLDDTATYFQIGLLAPSLVVGEKSAERPVALRMPSSEPKDFYFRKADGTSGTIKDVDSTASTANTKATAAGNTASSALNKATSLETVVGADANSGLRKRVSDLDSAVNNGTDGIAALKSAINTLKAQVNGIHYQDCLQQACKQITIPNLPWES